MDHPLSLALAAPGERPEAENKSSDVWPLQLKKQWGSVPKARVLVANWSSLVRCPSDGPMETESHRSLVAVISLKSLTFARKTILILLLYHFFNVTYP